MSIEALWSVEFQDVDGWRNGGVIVFETGRAFGGDSNYTYVGRYNVSGARVTGQLNVAHYSGPTNNAWGDTDTKFDVEVEGTVSGDDMNGQLKRPDKHGLSLPFRARKVAELP